MRSKGYVMTRIECAVKSAQLVLKELGLSGYGITVGLNESNRVSVRFAFTDGSIGEVHTVMTFDFVDENIYEDES